MKKLLIFIVFLTLGIRSQSQSKTYLSLAVFYKGEDNGYFEALEILDKSAVVLTPEPIIGFEKLIIVNDSTSGNFVTIESTQSERSYKQIPVQRITEIDTTYLQVWMDSTLFKVDFNLYQSLESFNSGESRLKWRHETQFLKSRKEKISNYNEFYYTNCLTLDSLFVNAKVLTLK